MKFNNLEKNEEMARIKLNKYYKKLGFKKLTTNGLLFLTLHHSRL